MNNHPFNLTREKLRVLIATPYGEDGMGGIDRLNDAIVRGLVGTPSLGIQCQRLVTRGKGSLISAQGVFAAALVRFATLALQRRVDLLHIHLSVRGSSYRKALLSRASRLLRIPYVVHLHGTDYLDFYQHASWPLRQEIGRMLRGSRRIIVLGRYWAQVIREIDPTVSDRISILPNATEAAPLHGRTEPSDRTAIAFLGQLGQRKGSADLLRALAQVKDISDWHATLGGDGAVAETRDLVRDLDLGTRVSVPGWLSASDRNALLARSDFLVLPSYAENLPMVVLEAFAFGLPVITTPVGATAEVVDSDRNGLLVQPGDIAGLAAAIRRLVQDPALRARMGAAAKSDHAGKYEIGQYIARLGQIWLEAADAHETAPELRHADL